MHVDTQKKSATPARPLQLHSTDELVHLARCGESTAFDELTRRHHALLFRTALRIVRNVQDAEDTVQDAYVHAFIRLGSFRGDSLFSTWLVRVTINSALMHLRKRKVRPTLSLCDILADDDASGSAFFRSTAPTPEAVCCDKERAERLHRALERLPEKLRIVVTMRLQHDHPIKRLAELSGITESAAKSRLLRARIALAQDLAA